MAIERTANGRYKVVVNIGTRKHRQRVTRTVDTEDTAVELEAALKAKPELARRRTLAEAAEHYVHIRSDDIDPQTEHNYRGLIARYFEPTGFGQTHIDELELDTVRSFYAQLRDGTYLDDNPAAKRRRRRGVRPLSVTTTKNVHRFVVSVLNDAVENGWIERNPAANAMRRRKGRAAARSKPIERYDLGAVTKVAAEADVDLADLMHLAILTGARVGELAALRWRDVDFAVGAVAFYGSVTKTRDKSGLERKSTKTGHPRVLGIDADGVAMLRARYERHTLQASDAGLAHEALDGRAVFSRDLEEGFTSPGALRGWWTRACDRAGVKLRFHDLRHIACSEMMAAGVPVPNATARSGHESNRVYHEVYGHMRVDSYDPALAALVKTWERIRPAGS